MTGGGPETAVALRVRGLVKHFGSTRALDGVDLELHPGEVHALCGENGAGKSTLVRVLAGMLDPDDGRVEWRSRGVRIESPATAAALGIAVIHQDYDLAPNLSVAENLLLGREPRRRGGWVDRREERRLARAALSRTGLDLDPATPVGELTAAQRQMVAIARALSRAARVLIMDEPTSTLGAAEAASLLERVAEWRDQGTAVIFISHKLEEVFAVADRVTVLRDGRSVATRRAGDTSPGEVVSLMVGRELATSPGRGVAPGNQVRLEARALGRSGAFRDIDFRLHAGEILGLYGLQGAGRSALAAALFGLAPADSGSLLLDGEACVLRSPREAMRRGVALVPEDRKARGLFPNFDVRENLSVAVLGTLVRGGLLRPRRERAVAADAASRFGVRSADLGQPVTELSGGNQQKALLARWLIRNPGVLILDEPTAGVDVGAKAEIYAMLQALAGAGVATLLITSEMTELLALSDRVLVMHEGAIVGRFGGNEASEERIMKAIQMRRDKQPEPGVVEGRSE